jgi:pyruvate/2-oxoglutarate dehydrogenase complex dihydrolipoamide dehydrogenase (E3) component
MPDPTMPRPARTRPGQFWDVAIIGAGSAGLAVAAACLRAQRSVVLFERGAPAHHGNAALLAAAQQARQGQRPAWDSWRHKGGNPLPAFAAHGVEIVEASAHFIAPDCIEAAGRTYPFRHAVIAAGHMPQVLDLHGLASIPWLTPETIGGLEEAPEHLLVLGGGAEAVELAQAHALLGCRVSLVQPMPNILPGEDMELVDPLRHQLRHAGIAVHENNAVLTVEHAGGGVALRLEGGARVEGSHLLLATARVPNLPALDLPAGRISTTPRGIAVRRDLRSTSNAKVWAAGSIADTGWAAAAHGQHAAVVADGLLHGQRTGLGDVAPPRLVLALPVLAQVGLTEAEARAAGHEPRALRLSLDGTPHGPGLVKLLADRHGRLLGASLLAPGAAEAAALLAVALRQGLTAHALAAQPMPRGTLAEAIANAADGLAGADFPSSPMRRILGALDRWR